jgi:hypothetical protein
MMDANIRERTQSYIHARHQHPAWQLLAARRAPLVLSCLRTLFEDSQDGIAFEDALQSLAELLTQHANYPEFDIGEGDVAALARKELRGWIKRALVIEREGRIYATDALEEAMRFVDALGGRIMTSTASRLSVVQREIESLESRLNPDPKSRADHIRRKIAELERELKAVNAGEIEVLDQAQAVEGIREIFALATGLGADFRRVEDSWRDADRRLRHSIVNEENHRGAIVDKLLDGHDTLLDTPEGRVFHGFQQQLGHSLELEAMKQRLRTILKHPAVGVALNLQQQAELRWLVMRLVKESAAVIRARARSERDVKGFLKTGLAAEHHRVGALLNELFQQALHVDWTRAAVRRKPGPLPPVAIASAGLPLVERLRFKSIDQDARRELELRRQAADLDQIDDDFWSSFDGLDREALVRDTLAVLALSGQTMGIAKLARELPSMHDLETIALWLSMAREAEAPIDESVETVDVVDREGGLLRFYVPTVALSAEALEGIEWEV